MVNPVPILQTIALAIWVPPIVWEYKLGNRSALEWVLDQYKEKQMPDTAEPQGD